MNALLAPFLKSSLQYSTVKCSKIALQTSCQGSTKDKKVLEECEEYSKLCWINYVLNLHRMTIHNSKVDNFMKVLSFKPSRHDAWRMRRMSLIVSAVITASGGPRFILAVCEYESSLNCFTFSPQWGLHTDIT